jgi:TfoX/Sxy family transcriptional regulator of competence genes
MFGGLCFLVNGHMCCGIVKNDLMLRLPPEIVAAALREPHTRPMDFTGRPMKSMIYVEAAGIDSDSSLERWVRSAEQLARALPAKKEKLSVPPRTSENDREKTFLSRFFDNVPFSGH